MSTYEGTKTNKETRDQRGREVITNIKFTLKDTNLMLIIHPTFTGDIRYDMLHVSFVASGSLVTTFIQSHLLLRNNAFLFR